MARIGPIIVQGHVALSDSPARGAGDRRGSIAHPEGLQDARRRRPSARAARRATPPSSRARRSPSCCSETASPAERLARTPLRARGKHRLILRHAARVGQQMMHEYLAVVGLRREPGQVVPDRRLQIELALVAKLQERECDERLADGSDLEQVRGRSRARAPRDAYSRTRKCGSARPDRPGPRSIPAHSWPRGSRQ